MKIRKEVKAGVLILVTLVMLIWGLNFLKGTNIFFPGDLYYGVYGRVDGLTKGSPIFYKGFKVGTVRDIRIHPAQKDVFLVSFSVTQPIVLYNNSIAQIYSLDLMGTKGIQLINYAGNRVIIAGDTLKTSVMGDLVDQVSMEVLPLKEKTEKLLVKLDTVLTNIGRVFSEKNKKGLENSIHHLYLTMENLALISARLNGAFEDDRELGKSLKNIENFTNTLQMQKANLNSITTNLAEFSYNLNQVNMHRVIAMADSTLNTLNQVLEKAKKGDGSLGMFLTDQTLYLNMQDAAANLDRLLADVRHNPERYLHFSAVNLGRRIYVDTDESMADVKRIVFKIKVAQSPVPLDIRNSIVLDDLPVYEDYDGNYYIYTVGETNSYSGALKLNDRLLSVFPGAVIVAYKDGKPIHLKSALRKIKIKN